MKPTLTKRKNYRGRILGYTARYAAFEGQGETKAEAVHALELAIEHMSQRLEEGVASGRWRNHAWVVAPTLEGWVYWIDTFARGHYEPTHVMTQEDCIDLAQSHLAQTIWDVNLADNDEHFIAGLSDKNKLGLRRYFKWQRRYALAIKDGWSDAEARLMADAVSR